MRILYVTGVWSGIEPVLFRGASETVGMPSFVKPLRGLVERGHEVSLCLITDDWKQSDLNVASDWAKRLDVTVHPFVADVGKVRGVLRAVRNARRRIDEVRPDLVYGQGSIGGIASLALWGRDVPYVQRLYGTFLHRLLQEHGPFQAMLRHPLEYIAFSSAGAYKLVTDDGTKGDEVYHQLKRGPSKLAFWHNGVDLDPAIEALALEALEDPRAMSERPLRMVFPARISYWKRQHLGIDLVAALKERGVAAELVLYGHVTDEDYFADLLRRAEVAGVSDAVKYGGAIPALELQAKMIESDVVLSFYDHTNLGNVSIESCRLGCLLVASDDGSLDFINDAGGEVLLVGDSFDAARRLADLWADPAEQTRRRQANMGAAARLFTTWEERVEREVAMLHEAAQRADAT